MKRYCIYLEPYGFIFQESEFYALYNTLNGVLLRYRKDEKAGEIIREIDEEGSNYCALIDDNDISNENIRKLISEIRDAFIGDILEIQSSGKRPFVAKPLLRLINDIHNTHDENMSGVDVVDNIHEVTFYSQNRCPHNCSYCHEYNKQHLFCTFVEEEYRLKKEEYVECLNRLHAVGGQKINLIVGAVFDNIIATIINTSEELEIGVDIYIHYRNVLKFPLENLNMRKNKLIILIDDLVDNNEFTLTQKRIQQFSVKWDFLITSEADYEGVEMIIARENLINWTITPFYTGNNLSFFEDNVFMRDEDILISPIARRKIFARQTLNEFFFGKIYIMPNGDVYTNFTDKPIANLANDTLGEIAYIASLPDSSWFLRRNQAPCNNCVYQWLCPSPSNYEFVIGRPNLCHVKP